MFLLQAVIVEVAYVMYRRLVLLQVSDSVSGFLCTIGLLISRRFIHMKPCPSMYKRPGVVTPSPVKSRYLKEPWLGVSLSSLSMPRLG